MLEPGLRTLSVSPRQLANLYHRCPRCLYNHVHSGKDDHVPGSTFRATASASIEAAKGPDGWIDIPSAQPVRIISNSIRADSAPIPFPEFDIALVIAPHPETLLESTDGKRILCAYRQREENGALRSVLRCSLEAAVLAAEHPADPADSLPRVDELGIVEFTKRLTPTGKGASIMLFQPARLIRLQREPEQFAMLLRVVARILAAKRRPPPSRDCLNCIGLGAGDKVPA